MPYLAIDDFKSGLDSRKSPLTAPAGSLTRLVNAAVTPGGEIQKRRAFVKVASLAGTTGLAAIGSKVVAFTRDTTVTAPPLNMVNNIATLEFHKLPLTSTTAKQTDFEVFDGNLYVVFYDKNGATPAAKNPHYYFDATASEGHTPTNAYVQTEGSGKGYNIRAFQGKMYSVTGKYIYFSSIKYPLLWEEAAKTPPSGATVVSVLPVQGVTNERVIIVSSKKTYRWNVGANNIGNWVEETTTPADLTWIDQSTQRTGCGYINTSLQETSGFGLQGIEIYYDKLAVMSDATTQLWSMDPDPNQNSLAQVLRNAGTRAPKSVQQYGSGDVLYLGSSGIRSLKARDASNSAAVTDIGSPVDNYIRGLAQKYPNGVSYLNNCVAINEPIVGRFWAVFPNEILVLSYFPGPKVQAWSVYTTTFIIDYVVTAGDTIFIRSGDDLYAFGGRTGLEYDNCAPAGVDVRFPYLDGGKPGHQKTFQALDATAEGAWAVAVSYNFDMQDAEEILGTLYPLPGKDTVSASTWNKGRFAMQGYASHVSMRFYNTTNTSATLSNCAIHYNLADDEA
jgi:hypothetical protein